MVYLTSFTEWGETSSRVPIIASAARGATRRDLLLVGLASQLTHTSLARGEEPTPMVVTVYGDSQAEGLAVALLAATRGGHFHIANRTKAGTALSQPVGYDWLAAIRHSVSVDHPAIAVMMFGGNDRVPARPPDGRVLQFRGDAWLAYYRDRLQTIISALTGAGARIVWCGDPNTRDGRYAEDMEYLNCLYRRALPAAGATFVDIHDVAAGPDGGYASHGTGVDGVVQRLRTDDGIHFTAAGYGIVARRVLRALEEITVRQPLSVAAEPQPQEHTTPARPQGGADLPSEQPEPEVHAGLAGVSCGKN
jgi:hypothetical protein